MQPDIEFKIFAFNNLIFALEISEFIFCPDRCFLDNIVMCKTGDFRLVFLRSVRWLLVKASVVPSSPILFTLMKEALGSSET
jgi:hypothetical protein